MLTQKYSTQVREKHCMQIIVQMKERIPLASRSEFMNVAFWDSYKSIAFRLLTKSLREKFRKETRELIKRFESCEQPMNTKLQTARTG